METVLVPAAAGVLSALGLVAADERRDTVRAYVVPLEEAGELPGEGEADLRYAGQSFELTVPLGPELAERFHEAHEARLRVCRAAIARLELVAVRTADDPCRRLDCRGARARALASPARRWSSSTGRRPGSRRAGPARRTRTGRSSSGGAR